MRHSWSFVWHSPHLPSHIGKQEALLKTNFNGVLAHLNRTQSPCSWFRLLSSCGVLLIDQREIPKAWQRKLLIALDGPIWGLAAQAYNWLRERERGWITLRLLWDKHVVRPPPPQSDLKETLSPVFPSSGARRPEAGIVFSCFYQNNDGWW